MSTWILIVFLLGNPAQTGGSVAMQEFNSHESCDAAAKVINSMEAGAWGKRVACVPK